MIALTEIETLLITCLPALTSIGSILAATVTIFKALNKLKDNEEVRKERDELREQNKQFMAELKSLRKQTSLFIETASKVVYKDISEVKNDKDLQI